MNDRAFTEFFKYFSTPTREEFDVGLQSDDSTPTNSRNSIYENVQIFSDHLKTTKRFQKTFYYGDLLQSSFHPPFTLADATLELFNKTVPNACRLDILDLDYATSVSKAVCVSPYSMVLAMIYLEQLRHKNPDYLENVSPCELFVVSILVASKYLFDYDEEFTYNYDWADAANIDIQDLNKLEKEFLHAMNWELFTAPSDFFKFLSKVEEHIAFKQSLQRGWFSYSELFVICQNEALSARIWMQLTDAIMKTVFVATLSYAAAVSVIYGAVSITFVSQELARTLVDGITSTNDSSISTNGLIESLWNDYSDEATVELLQLSQLHAFDLCGKEDNTPFKNYGYLTYNTTFNYTCWKEHLLNYKSKSDQRYSIKEDGNDMKETAFFLPEMLFNVEKQNLVSSVNCHSVVIQAKCNFSMSQA